MLQYKCSKLTQQSRKERWCHSLPLWLAVAQEPAKQVDGNFKTKNEVIE